MTYFDETQPYWGNHTKPIIGTGNYRLTTRSVKIFADGISTHHIDISAVSYPLLISRCFEDWWSLSKYFTAHCMNLPLADMFISSTSPMLTTLQPKGSCASIRIFCSTSFLNSCVMAGKWLVISSLFNPMSILA